MSTLTVSFLLHRLLDSSAGGPGRDKGTTRRPSTRGLGLSRLGGKYLFLAFSLFLSNLEGNWGTGRQLWGRRVAPPALGVARKPRALG